MGSPFFSIILPTYNRALFLDRSVTSVIKQSFDDWELIIIDDGSTDASYEVVQKYFYDDRIKYHYQENKKLSRARNAGLDKVIGRYVCFFGQ